MNQFDYRTATSEAIALHLPTKHVQTYFRMHSYHSEKGNTAIVLKLERAKLLMAIAEAESRLREFDEKNGEVG